VVQGRGVGQVIVAAAQETHVGFVIFISRQNIANFAVVENFPAQGDMLHHGTEAGVGLGGAGRVGRVGGGSQEGRRQDVVEREHGRISSGRRAASAAAHRTGCWFSDVSVWGYRREQRTKRGRLLRHEVGPKRLCSRSPRPVAKRLPL